MARTSSTFERMQAIEQLFKAFEFQFQQLAELRELSRLRQGVELTEPRPLAPDLPCTPSSLGPPWAMVEHVEEAEGSYQANFVSYWLQQT